MTVDAIHAVLRSHGEHPIGQVRTAGVRGFVGADGSIVEAPLWLTMSTHRAWLVAVHDGEVRAVATGNRQDVEVHRGWIVDEAQVGPWRAPLRPSTRASAERLVRKWKAASPHGDPAHYPPPVEVSPERAPAARGAQVPEDLVRLVPRDPHDRWLRAEQTRSEQPFDRDDGKIDRAPVWVLVSERAAALAATLDDGRVWSTPLAALEVTGSGRTKTLLADGRPLRPRSDPSPVAELLAAAPSDRWHDQALALILAGSMRDAIRLVGEALERGHERAWALAARLLYAAGDPLRAMSVAVGMLRRQPNLPIRELCHAWHPAVDAQRLRADDADVHFLRALLRPVLGDLEVVEPPSDLPWPPTRPDEVFAAALAHLNRPADAVELWSERSTTLTSLESLAVLRTAAGDPTAADSWEAAARAHRDASSPRAGELLDRALELDPDPARHYLRAAWAWAAGDDVTARGHWTAAMLLDPDATIRPELPADAERALAHQAHLEDEPDHEAYAWERAARLDPDHERSWLEAATLYADALDDPAHGAELLDAWCAHADTLSDPPVPRWPRWCRLAELRLRAGRPTEAVAALREAVRHDPLRPEAWARAIALGAETDAPLGWWSHVHGVLTGTDEGAPTPACTELSGERLDALHPGGVGWLERVRAQVGSKEPPSRADLVRGLERLNETEHPTTYEDIQALAHALGMGCPDVFVFRGEGAFGCSAWGTEPPLILLGVDHLVDSPRKLSRASVRFLVAVELVHLVAGHPVLAFDTDLLGTSRTVYQSFGAYASTAENVVDVLTLVPGVDQVAKLQTIVSLSRRVFTTRATLEKVGDLATPVLDKLGLLPEEAGPGSVGRQGLVGAALQFRMQADRAALLLVGDLEAAVDAILKASTQSHELAGRVADEGVLRVLDQMPPESIRLTALLQFAASLPSAEEEA